MRLAWWPDLVVIGAFTGMFSAYCVLLRNWIRSPSFVLLMLKRLDPQRIPGSEPFLRASICAAEADRIIRRWCRGGASGAIAIEAYMHGFVQGLYAPRDDRREARSMRRPPFGTMWTAAHLDRIKRIGFSHGLSIGRSGAEQ